MQTLAYIVFGVSGAIVFVYGTWLWLTRKERRKFNRAYKKLQDYFKNISEQNEAERASDAINWDI